MRFLPPLAAGSKQWLLPLADRSAAALAEFLIKGDPPGDDDLLAGILASDPSLLIWTICKADKLDDFCPRSVADAASWLKRRALQVLQWPADSQASAVERPDEMLAAFGSLAAAGIAVSEMASILSAAQGREAIELAKLLGLLHNAGAWLDAAGGGSAEDAGGCLPDWLLRVNRSDEVANCAVRAAAGLFSEDANISDANAAPVDIESKNNNVVRATNGSPGLQGKINELPDIYISSINKCRNNGREAARRWLEPVAGMSNCLAKLVLKLARLAELESRFQEALEREKLEAMAEFAAGAGHEINNPLTVIAGRAQLFLQSETDPERRRALALMNAQAMRVYEMIADMRLFARPPRPEPRPLELSSLIDGVIIGFAPRAARQDTELLRQGEIGPVEIEADAAQINVAVRALCQNALESLVSGGRVAISLSQSERDARIQVSDNGPGIPPEQRSRLFDPFYSARQAGRGLGLGLSKSWRIVANHGGRIEVSDNSPRGAVFTIVLPKQFCRDR
jgi:signal transduction histidine kinase